MYSSGVTAAVKITSTKSFSRQKAQTVLYEVSDKIMKMIPMSNKYPNYPLNTFPRFLITVWHVRRYVFNTRCNDVLFFQFWLSSEEAKFTVLFPIWWNTLADVEGNSWWKHFLTKVVFTLSRICTRGPLDNSIRCKCSASRNKRRQIEGELQSWIGVMSRGCAGTPKLLQATQTRDKLRAYTSP